MDILLKYFPELTAYQKDQFFQLNELYTSWNQKINLISRKDIEFLYLKHILHSLAIARFIQFNPGTIILDVGTGGGFPGIPLAILFPECSFYLIDSIGKKIKVVNQIKQGIGLQNVRAEQVRAENVKSKFHFIVSRAVTDFSTYLKWVKGKILDININDLKNGIIYLKGGDLSSELRLYPNKIKVTSISDFFEEDFFDTKKIVYYPL